MSNKQSGYHVTIEAFVPFDPKNMKDVADKAPSLALIQDGEGVSSVTLGLFSLCRVKGSRFMGQMPKHMEEGEEAAPEPAANDAPTTE